ncbi:hypothetical protein BK816_06620 [Boudabousia tangfeifanii]|uniref:Uncharacterized protein n=1 Tax=Boudabousia tangfeifanii TaxID=1912795 RepID=A0A1D9MKW1_9ACTO|nr:hypothetical protein BK816_06620 [Boudabousia tangfeifanii]
MLVGIIIGLVYALGALVGLSVAVVSALMYQSSAPYVPLALIGAQEVLVVALILIPLLYTGFDRTLSPELFSPFLAPSKKLGNSLLIAALFPVWWLFFLLLSLAPLAAWIVVGEPLLAVISVFGSLLGFAITWMLSRALGAKLGSYFRERRGKRELVSTIGALLLLTVGVFAGVGSNYLASLQINWMAIFQTIYQVLQFVPLFSAFTLPLLAQSSSWLLAVVVFVVNLALLVLLYFWYHRELAFAMHGRAEGGVRQINRPQQVAKTATKQSHSHPLVMADRFAHLGLSPASSAIAARSWRYWFKDSRYSMSLPAIIMLDVLAVITARSDFMKIDDGTTLAPFYFFIVYGSLLLGISLMTTVSLDSTALWHQVVAGVPGKTDLLGRVVAAFAWQLPLNLIALIVLPMLVPQVSSVLLAVLVFAFWLSGASAGIFAGGNWVLAVKSPKAGAFSNEGAGHQFFQALMMIAISIVSMILAIPPVALYFALANFVPTLTWLSVVFSLLWGVGSLWLAITSGGKALSRKYPYFLEKLRSWPGHTP